MEKRSLALTVSLLCILSGCGFKDGVKTEERAAYLYFTGNAKGSQVRIDNTTMFTIEKTGPNEQYKIAPGKHTIIVEKDGKVLVERNLLLGDGIEREISVP